MFGKKEIANLKAIIKTDAEMIDALTAANADCQQKLKNAQALIQRAEAERDMHKKRADENYAALEQYRNSAVEPMPFTAAVLAEADGFEPPKPKKKR